MSPEASAAQQAKDLLKQHGMTLYCGERVLAAGDVVVRLFRGSITAGKAIRAAVFLRGEETKGPYLISSSERKRIGCLMHRHRRALQKNLAGGEIPAGRVERMNKP